MRLHPDVARELNLVAAPCRRGWAPAIFSLALCGMLVVPAFAQTPAKDAVAPAKVTKTLSDDQIASYIRLGDLYMKGDGVPKDPAKAFQFYSLAKAAGSRTADVKLAMMSFEGVGGTSDREAALKTLEALAEAGNAAAALFVGDVHSGKYGDPAAPEKALAAYAIAAKAGDQTALLHVGDFYSAGNAVDYDPAKAAEAYRSAADAGSRTGAIEFARLQALGEGVKRDPDAAMARLAAIPEDGRASALLAEGDLKLRGGAATLDIDGAIAAYAQAAEMGQVSALVRLGDLYNYENFGRQQPKTALSYYRQAADKGDKYGQLALAKAQLAKPKTAKAGLQALKALAAEGFAEADVAIANASLRGIGVKQNAKDALAQLSQLAAKGNIAARLRLIELYRDGSKDGRVWLVKRNVAKARAELAALEGKISLADFHVQDILLDVAAGKLAKADALAERLSHMPPSKRQRLVRDLRESAQPLYADYVRLALRRAGYPVADGGKKKSANKAFNKALQAYCADRNARKLCAGGLASPQTAEVLAPLF